MAHERIDWDELERRGHDFTLVAPMHIGRSTYWCENCGCVLVVVNAEIVVAGAPRAHHDPLTRCYGSDQPASTRQRPKLVDQLKQLDEEDYARLRDRD